MEDKLHRTILLSFPILFFSVLTADSQFEYINNNYGPKYFTTEDYPRHINRASGIGIAPYRYRILTDKAVSLFDGGNSITYKKRLYYFRVLQNAGILAFSYLLAGIWAFPLTAWSLSHCFYQSDVSAYTYSNLFFFLLAAVILKKRRAGWWLIGLTAIAALNREEAVFLPILAFAYDKWNWKWSAASMIGFFIVFASLRLFIGWAPAAGSRYGDVYPGLQLFLLNVQNAQAWKGLIGCAGASIIGLLFYRFWSPQLKRLFWLVALPITLLEFAFGSADETRLFLVPVIVVLIQATAHFLNKLSQPNKKRVEVEISRIDFPT